VHYHRRRHRANLLRLTPILANHRDGRIAPGGTLFGRANLLRKFVRFLVRRMDPQRPYRIGIGHANAPEAAQALLAELQRSHERIVSHFVMPVGSALSVHGGPGTLVVGIQDEDRAL
jgi:fatty acid-binding protein DegV